MHVDNFISRSRSSIPYYQRAVIFATYSYCIHPDGVDTVIVFSIQVDVCGHSNSMSVPGRAHLGNLINFYLVTIFLSLLEAVAHSTRTLHHRIGFLNPMLSGLRLQAPTYTFGTSISMQTGSHPCQRLWPIPSLLILFLQSLICLLMSDF